MSWRTQKRVRDLLFFEREERELAELRAQRNKTWKIYKRVAVETGGIRLVFCDEVAAHSEESAIEMAIRGVHGGNRYEYFAREV